MDIWIRPTLESLADDEDGVDEENDDALAFEQGFESWTEEVQPGETFEIPEGYEGIVDGEVILDGAPDYTDTLSNGTYRLSEDEVRVQRV